MSSPQHGGELWHDAVQEEVDFVLGKLGPGQSGPVQLGPGAQLSNLFLRTVDW